ncbi:MAG TPA: alkaline phosphatase family protein [Solirubrobacteraceae bacterium]|nr:alkaline phosphatase family protein [Solirubrobacteraceae bacterium]
MSELLQDAERAALRGVAHLLPAKWREIVDVAAAPVPPTPAGTMPAPADAAAARLERIEHIVVVMLENRSFDHMLGYLSLPPELGGRGRAAVDGLRGPGEDVNDYDGRLYPIHHLAQTAFAGEAEDPDHSGRSVDEQLADGGKGFVANFARTSSARAAKLGVPAPDPGLVMGYYDGDDLPVYDHLASEHCVVDRWFSSVPGATWPNRLYSVAGRAAGSRDDVSPPLYALPSFARHLDRHGVDWRWYSFDPGTLRAIDPAYRLSNHHRFAFVDSRKLSSRERAAGELTEEGPSFLDDVAAGRLPAVSWIDPRFKDLRVLGPDSNDDHPPGDVLAGQDLILTIYHALSSAPTWASTLLVVVYDEHGGFYDHVSPPAAVDEDPDFRRLGVRVPALLVSPLVARESSSSSLLGPDFHFDHTSIVKTILTRFCGSGGQIPASSARVAAAQHLGHLLSDPGTPARVDVADHGALAQRMVRARQGWAQARFADPVAAARPPGRLTDFQTGFYDMARLLRHAGLPGGHP